MLKRKNGPVLPPGKIGIIGGGQLGKMLTFEAKRMGYTVIVLDPTPNSPAGQVADKQIVGSLQDFSEIRKLAELTDVITYEFEFVNADVLSELEEEGTYIHFYGKKFIDVKKKIRHITILDDTLEIAEDKAMTALKNLAIKPAKEEN